MRKLLGLFMVISLLLAGSIGAYAEQITLHMWGHSNAFFEQANRDIIAAYEALNPNVKIIYETFPYDTFLQKSLTSFSVGEQPDILEMSGRLIMSYAKNGLVEPVPAELMTTEEMEEAFLKVPLAATSTTACIMQCRGSRTSNTAAFWPTWRSSAPLELRRCLPPGMN